MSLPVLQRALESHPGGYAFACALIGYAAAANQLHRWAHMEAPARPVRWLQRSGLVLSPRRHARHHRAPRTSAYCISTGWLNPLLDRSGCWRALERAVARASGVAPRAFETDEPLE